MKREFKVGDRNPKNRGRGNRMKIDIKCRFTEKILFECEAGSMRAAVEGAVEKRIDLKGADPRGADLEDIKKDFFTRLSKAKSEVVGLYKTLLEGRVNGSCYRGECACFVGTIAKVRGCDVNDLYEQIGLEMNVSSPTEQWFLAILQGDTPESNPVAGITADWIREFAKEQSIALPERKIVWKESTP
jgi:hypothetical protein